MTTAPSLMTEGLPTPPFADEVADVVVKAIDEGGRVVHAPRSGAP